jgi:hypothetical protein
MSGDAYTRLEDEDTTFLCNFSIYPQAHKASLPRTTSAFLPPWEPYILQQGPAN